MKLTLSMAAGMLLLTQAALAEEPWETVVSGPIVVKTRPRAGTETKEVWAEGEIAAPVQDIQAALMDPESFPKWMPYVKEARVLGKPEADGTHYVYTRLDLPFVSSRDYVSRVKMTEGVKPDGTGLFAEEWAAVPDRIPSRHNIVRLRINEGSWRITAKGDGTKSHAVYRFASDPGGSVPTFAANMGNKTGVSDTFKAIEKEALRRLAARKAAAPKP